MIMIIITALAMMMIVFFSLYTLECINNAYTHEKQITADFFFFASADGP